MTQISYPFENSEALGELQWSKMMKHLLGTGVILNAQNNLGPYADSTGMNVKILSGEAWIRGHYYESDAQEVLSINTADVTNPRIDRIILRLDWTENNIRLAILQGTPAVSPVAPALTENTTRWEIPIAQVRVNAGVVTIAAGDITDERIFVKNANAPQTRWTDLVLLNGWTNYTSSNPAQWRINEFGYVQFKGAIRGPATSGVVAVLPSQICPDYERILPYIYNDFSVQKVEGVHIHPNGNFDVIITAANWLALDGLTYFIE